MTTVNTPSAARAGAKQNKLELLRRHLFGTNRTGASIGIAGWIKIEDPPGPYKSLENLLKAP